MLDNKRILFATGGTGGHINPAIAVADLIRRRFPSAVILFVGTAEKMESRLVPAAGFDFETIDISGFQRSLTAANIKKNIAAALKLMRSSSRSVAIIKKFKPDVAVGFGGYVSGPVIMSAARLGIPTAIHEQNAFPGVTNKILAKRVDAVMLTVQASEKYLTPKNPCIVTGLPVRDEIVSANRELSRFELGLDERPLILSTGGSLGARVINERIAALITAKHKDEDCFFLHAYGQYGRWMPDRLREAGVDLDKEKHIMLREYISDMHRCLAAADIVVGRSGASSISEIEAAGKASILIPSPNVAENHQYHNAMALVRNGAALMIEEKNLTEERLLSEVNELLKNREKIDELGKKAGEMAIVDSARRILKVIENVAGK